MEKDYKEYLEKSELLYVIVTLDLPTLYLHKTPGKKEWVLTDNIDYATKTKSRKLAEELKNYYFHDTMNFNEEIVVVPIKREYSIIEPKERG